MSVVTNVDSQAVNLRFSFLIKFFASGSNLELCFHSHFHSLIFMFLFASKQPLSASDFARFVLQTLNDIPPIPLNCIHTKQLVQYPLQYV